MYGDVSMAVKDLERARPTADLVLEATMIHGSPFGGGFWESGFGVRGAALVGSKRAVEGALASDFELPLSKVSVPVPDHDIHDSILYFNLRVI